MNQRNTCTCRLVYWALMHVVPIPLSPNCDVFVHVHYVKATGVWQSIFASEFVLQGLMCKEMNDG